MLHYKEKTAEHTSNSLLHKDTNKSIMLQTYSSGLDGAVAADHVGLAG